MVIGRVEVLCKLNLDTSSHSKVIEIPKLRLNYIMLITHFIFKDLGKHYYHIPCFQCKIVGMNILILH